MKIKAEQLGDCAGMLMGTAGCLALLVNEVQLSDYKEVCILPRPCPKGKIASHAAACAREGSKPASDFEDTDHRNIKTRETGPSFFSQQKGVVCPWPKVPLSNKYRTLDMERGQDEDNVSDLGTSSHFKLVQARTQRKEKDVSDWGLLCKALRLLFAAWIISPESFAACRGPHF